LTYAISAVLDHEEPLPHPACDHKEIRPRKYHSRGPISYGARYTPDRRPSWFHYEAALLRLLRVKCSLLDLRPLYQFPDPIEQTLIGATSSSIINTTERRFCFNAPPPVGSGYFVLRFDKAVSAKAA
jgi:hypothetical protein